MERIKQQQALDQVIASEIDSIAEAEMAADDLESEADIFVGMTEWADRATMDYEGTGYEFGERLSFRATKLA